MDDNNDQRESSDLRSEDRRRRESRFADKDGGRIIFYINFHGGFWHGYKPLPSAASSAEDSSNKNTGGGSGSKFCKTGNDKDASIVSENERLIRYKRDNDERKKSFARFLTLNSSDEKIKYYYDFIRDDELFGPAAAAASAGGEDGDGRSKGGHDFDFIVDKWRGKIGFPPRFGTTNTFSTSETTTTTTSSDANNRKLYKTLIGYLKERCPPEDLVLGFDYDCFSQEWLVNRILKDREGKEFGGFLVLQHGGESLKSDPTDNYGFIHQRCKLRESDIGPYTASQLTSLMRIRSSTKKREEEDRKRKNEEEEIKFKAFKKKFVKGQYQTMVRKRLRSCETLSVQYFKFLVENRGTCVA